MVEPTAQEWGWSQHTTPRNEVIPTYHPQEWGRSQPTTRCILLLVMMLPNAPRGSPGSSSSGEWWEEYHDDITHYWISRWHHHDDITHYITMTSHTISRWHHTLLNSHASWQLQCSRKCWFSICGLDALPIIIVYVCHATYTCTYRHCDNGYAPTNRMK